jgi:hypothetical protein
MSNEQVKSVAKKANTEVATVDFEQYADIGFENIGSKDLALPFLKILSHYHHRLLWVMQVTFQKQKLE